LKFKARPIASGRAYAGVYAFLGHFTGLEQTR
jgi:hypothetical protein